jgi:hypothetical protein
VAGATTNGAPPVSIVVAARGVGAGFAAQHGVERGEGEQPVAADEIHAVLGVELVTVTLPPLKACAFRTPLNPEFVTAASPPLAIAMMRPKFEPEFTTVALTPKAWSKPLLLPELIAVALPPFCARAVTVSVLLPELIAVALPPPVVNETKPFAVPVLVVGILVRSGRGIREHSVLGSGIAAANVG